MVIVAIHLADVSVSATDVQQKPGRAVLIRAFAADTVRFDKVSTVIT